MLEFSDQSVNVAGDTTEMSGGTIAAIIAGIGAVFLTPLFKLLLDRVAAGDKAWHDRVAKLEADINGYRTEIAELRGEMKTLSQLLSARDSHIARLEATVDRQAELLKERDRTIAEQDLLNERLLSRLKAYEPDFTA